MNLQMLSPGTGLTSATQIARIMTERWADENLYCPSCLAEELSQYQANRPVADFSCRSCSADFELKSSKRNFGSRLANGAYHVKVQRLESDTSPSLFLLRYDGKASRVLDLTVVPARFFRPSIIEKRRPLAAGARRAGWVGSNIRLDLIPKLGLIDMIRGSRVTEREKVKHALQRTAFLSEVPQDARSWIADVIACVERIPTDEFTISDVYSFEPHLAKLYPNNRNVRPKIRQQLQVMRDQNLLEFLDRGRYRKLF